MRSVLILVLTLWTASIVAAEQKSLFAEDQLRALAEEQAKQAYWQVGRAQEQVARAYQQAAQFAGRSNWEQNLFPPELVMRHRAALELTEKQRSELIVVIQQFQAAMVPVEWELQDAKLELEKILAMYPTPQKEVEQALDSVFIHEAQIKKRHILMLVKVKNVLNQKQIDFLLETPRGWYGRGYDLLED